MKFISIKTIAAVFILFLTACTDYGEKTKKGHVEVYYKEGISKETAQRTADFLYAVDREANNDTTVRKSMQLIKKEDTICFRMVADKKRLSSVNDGVFYSLANYLSDTLFNHAPVNIELTDDHFKTIHNIRFTKMDLPQPVE